MKKSDDKNYFSLIHFFSKAFFLGVGISKILINTRESAIFSFILGTILGALILFLLNKFHFYESKGFRKITMFILLYILLIMGVTEFVNLISNIYLRDTNKFIIILPLLIVMMYINSKDISVHLKVNSITLSISICIFIISFIALAPDIDYLNYLPLFNTNIKKILFSSFEYALYSTVPCILYGGIKSNIKNETPRLIKNYFISNIFLILTILIAQGILSIELIDLFKYPEYVVFKKITMLDFINNVENILSLLWLFTIFGFLNLCSKLLYDISNSTFNNKYIYPIFLFISIFFISSYLFDNIEFILFLYNYTWLILLIILIIYILINLSSLKKSTKKQISN